MWAVTGENNEMRHLARSTTIYCRPLAAVLITHAFAATYELRAGEEPVRTLEITSEETLPPNAMKTPEPTDVQFRGRTYQPDEAVGILVAAGVDEKTPPGQRREALLKLDDIASRLRGSPLLLNLIDRFFREPNEDCRFFLVRCLLLADDERALPFFVDVLKDEVDQQAWLGAAVGLAKWNVRAGVAALIGALQRCADGHANDTDLRLAHHALISLRNLNERKNWGAPRWATTGEGLEPGLTPVQVCQREAARWSDWFANNRDRFPVYEKKANGD